MQCQKEGYNIKTLKNRYKNKFGTYLKEETIKCDFCNTSYTGYEIRTHLIKNGWIITPENNYCPICKPKMCV